jgi:hypothetical protein
MLGMLSPAQFETDHDEEIERVSTTAALAA